jgi:hypothetical protein
MNASNEGRLQSAQCSNRECLFVWNRIAFTFIIPCPYRDPDNKRLFVDSSCVGLAASRRFGGSFSDL